MQNANYKSHLELHFIVFIWGFTAILGKLISLESLPLVWTRILIAIACISLYLIIQKKNIRLPLKTTIKLITCGFIIALHWLTFFHAIKISNISITLACISTGAFFTSILEPIFFKRKIIWYEVLLGAIVVIGLLLIFSVETQYIAGITVGLISSVLSASFSIINGKLANKHDSVTISFYQLIGGLLFLSIFLLIFRQFNSHTFHFQKYDWLWLLILGGICTAYPFIGTINIMRHLSPYTVMLSINLEPIYGTLLALILFTSEEKMTPMFYIGAAIILTTVVLNTYFKNKKKVLDIQ